MPVVLPHIGEAVSPTYDPSYIPGYTGYVPKLRSEIGSTYGNATLRLLTYEPGQPKSPRLTLTVSGAEPALPGPRHLVNRTFGHPEINTYAGQVEDRNIKKGYFYPRNGNYHYALRHYICDGDPRTTAAIQTVEAVKAEIRGHMSRGTSGGDRAATVMSSLESMPQSSGKTRGILKSSNSPAFRSSPGPFPVGRTPLKVTLQNTPERIQTAETSEKTEDLLQQKQGRTIYRTECGLLPNYAGYTPGHKFVYGKTWGVSTANIGSGQQKPFQFTSLF